MMLRHGEQCSVSLNLHPPVIGDYNSEDVITGASLICPASSIEPPEEKVITETLKSGSSFLTLHPQE